MRKERERHRRTLTVTLEPFAADADGEQRGVLSGDDRPGVLRQSRPAALKASPENVRWLGASLETHAVHGAGDVSLRRALARFADPVSI